jgi:TetR/AcrR family transcriptional repressor of nem operon
MGEFDNPYIVGGCPILNTAVECDDTNPELRVLVQAAIDEWRQILVGLVEQGIANGEFRPTLSPDLFATLLIAALEGALMMSKAAADPAPLRQVIDYWQDYVREQMVVPR